MNTFRVFDIETTALPEDDIKDLLPEFRQGNVKDAEKIKLKWSEHIAKSLENAAKHALTGKVLVVGIKEFGGECRVMFHDSEAELLKLAWVEILKMSDDLRIPYVVGFRSNEFDLPFMIQRSFILGVEVPSGVRNGRYFDRRFIDLQDIWQCGINNERGSLDVICRACGIGQKTGHGKDFGRLWETDRPKAIEYSKNDLFMTEQLALRMGVGSMAL